jgi:hypothetical protein
MIRSNDKVLKTQSALLPIGSLAAKWLGWALVFLLLITITGLALRYYFTSQIPGLSFNNIKHGHSHTAMLGWAFMAAAALLLALFSERTRYITQYKWLLGLNVVAVMGMWISFPLQGYGFYSIFFSTMHVLLAYWFSILFLRDIRKSTAPKLARSFARWSVIWMVVSTVGIWSVALVAALGTSIAVYYMSIQWYLHFQLVGWFTYAVLAGLIAYSHNRGFSLNLPRHTFSGVQISLILTYALSVKWSVPTDVLFYVNAAGVLIQVAAFYFIIRELYRILFKEIKFGHRVFGWLLKIGLFSLAARILIQAMVVIPAVAEISYTLRMYVIAFIHLIMVGVFTLTLAGIMGEEGFLRKNVLSTGGWGLYIVAFIVTELLLFVQGTMLWAGLGFISSFYLILFYASALFPAGVILVLAGQLKRDQKTKAAFSLIKK